MKPNSEKVLLAKLSIESIIIKRKDDLLRFFAHMIGSEENKILNDIAYEIFFEIEKDLFCED